MRSGDRVDYRGVTWRVVDYSTYEGAGGYETEEWQLQPAQGETYYLLRERDPNNPEELIHWYLAQELEKPQVFDGYCSRSITNNFWDNMQNKKAPYPELQLYGKTYFFESQTDGSYRGEEETEYRVTWDYWDRDHQSNFAIEAWADGSTCFYLSRGVVPEQFSVEKASNWQVENSTAVRRNQLNAETSWQIVGSFALIFVGILLMIFG